MSPVKPPDPPRMDMASMLELLGAEGREGVALGHLAGPDARRPAFAFLALDVTKSYTPAAREVKRSLVLLANGTLVSFAIVVPAGESAEPAGFLEVLGSGSFERLAEIDVQGVRGGNWVVLFYDDVRTARSPFSVDVAQPLMAAMPAIVPAPAGSGSALRDTVMGFVVTGLAPGTWEIWHDGWLVDPDHGVRPEAGAMYFEGRAGSYFFRKL